MPKKGTPVFAGLGVRIGGGVAFARALIAERAANLRSEAPCWGAAIGYEGSMSLGWDR